MAGDISINGPRGVACLQGDIHIQRLTIGAAFVRFQTVPEATVFVEVTAQSLNHSSCRRPFEERGEEALLQQTSLSVYEVTCRVEGVGICTHGCSSQV
jgi:hypothetical protein